MLPKIISKEQSAFVQGRNIADNISIAQEITCDLDKKVRGGNSILKLDMMKAYDRLEWFFLYLVLERFGFSFLLSLST